MNAYATKLSLEGARRALAELERRNFALSHAAGALSFDAVTAAPPGNRAARSETIGYLGEAQLELVNSAEGIRLLDFLAEHMDELTEPERRSVRLLRRSGDILRAVSLEEYLSFRKLANEASNAWSRANESGGFSLLEPWLGRLFFAARHIARAAAPDAGEYDFWLDFNEEGLTEARCAEFFAELEGRTEGLIERASRAEPPDMTVLGYRVSPLRQQRIAHFNMDALGVDRGRCRLAVSDHAFTAAFSRYDVRICTRYLPESWTTSLYGVMHECGHALYELNTAAALQFTPLAAGASVGVHESQSRLYENMIGRSLAWTEFIWPVLTENIPELAEHTPRELFRAANAFRRTPLRTEADEFTYCRHIILRFELERALFAGEISVHDAPAMWDELSEKLLGVRPRGDSEGILQDPHWASGQLGYFPAYAFGTVAAAQLYGRICAETGAAGALAAGDLRPVNGWLREHIWQYGALYPPRELLRRTLGGALDAGVYADYLADKLREVYGE